MEQLKSKYDSYSEWIKSDRKAYQYAIKNNLIPEICKMFGWELPKKKPNGFWTLDKCKAEALKHDRRGKWAELSSASYNFAKKRNWLDECCEHMLGDKKKPNGYWTLERCKKAALRFERKIDWKKNPDSSYQQALKNGWLDECCGHMVSPLKPSGYWTKERCIEEALKHKTRNQWRLKSSGSYSVAQKSGFLDECCGHMVNGLLKINKI